MRKYVASKIEYYALPLTVGTFDLLAMSPYILDNPDLPPRPLHKDIPIEAILEQESDAQVVKLTPQEHGTK